MPVQAQVRFNLVKPRPQCRCPARVVACHLRLNPSVRQLRSSSLRPRCHHPRPRLLRIPSLCLQHRSHLLVARPCRCPQLRPQALVPSPRQAHLLAQQLRQLPPHPARWHPALLVPLAHLHQVPRVWKPVPLRSLSPPLHVRQSQPHARRPAQAPPLWVAALPLRCQRLPRSSRLPSPSIARLRCPLLLALP